MPVGFTARQPKYPAANNCGFAPALTAGKFEEIILYLITHGADVNAMPEGSSSLPLAAAVEDDMLSIMRLLLENGADPTLYTDRSNATLVDVAYESGNHKIVNLLGGYGQYPFHMLDDDGNKI